MESIWTWVALGGIGVLTTLGLSVLLAMFFRVVVPTNEVHIVQSASSRVSYGGGSAASYYLWPAWIPKLGVRRTILPTSVFDLDLKDYEAYDKGRLPFEVDVKAFFRLGDSNVAAQRVNSFGELKEQLRAIVQGSIRSILAGSEIDEILQGRATFGELFTKEIKEQLEEWGVVTVKNIELMDIRDTGDSQVIHNIMAKKKSHIEMESRTEVAKNKKTALSAEIEAQKEIDLQKQEAAQSVGLRTVEAQRQVALQEQSKAQAVKEQERTTKEKEMQILSVEHNRKAEIAKDVAITQAQMYQETNVLNARGLKDAQVLKAEGDLEAKRRESEGITLEGTARAEAEKAMQLAPIEAQIVLSKEIGTNKSYQEYLVTIRKVEAQQAIGVEQAKSLEKADIKIIANSGSVTSGINSLGDLFTAQGGTAVGAMMEGLANTEVGAAVVEKFTGKKSG